MTPANVLELIALVRAERSSRPSEGLWRRVESFREVFDWNRCGRGGSMNIFTFHANCSPECAVIDVVDAKRDNAKIDYDSMQQHLIWCAYEHCAEPCIYVISDHVRRIAVRGEPNFIVLNVDRRRLMFERVLAMCAYVHSAAFDRDTAFLDTDAFPNAPLEQVFECGFDVALTYRHGTNLMPLNEGVIYASRRNVEAVRRFFRSYLATFEVLETNAHVRAFYGAIAAWRGGQLSLNVVGLPYNWTGGNTTIYCDDARIHLLPCDIFNYSPDNEADLPQNLAVLLRGKFIVHIKGQNKRHFWRLRQDAMRDCALAPLLNPTGTVIE